MIWREKLRVFDNNHLWAWSNAVHCRCDQALADRYRFPILWWKLLWESQDLWHKWRVAGLGTSLGFSQSFQNLLPDLSSTSLEWPNPRLGWKKKAIGKSENSGGQLVKFMFSKKATKIDETFMFDLTLCSKCQINGEDFVNLCGLLRKHQHPWLR